MSAEGLKQAIDKMHRRGVDQRAITVFSHYYEQLEEGVQGTIPEGAIEPLRDVPALEGFSATAEARREALAATVVIKLNGGLGTGMGLAGPKTALPVRGGLTFLDIIARQILALRERHGVDLPLLLMHSFRTREESLAILATYPDLPVHGLPLDFLQNAEPKLRADDLTPVSWPADPEMEWCPPGHGDLFVALLASGALKSLRDKGFRYAFVSNSDNLGATCDPDVAAWMIEQGAPYVAEVCERTVNDRKGGHLAVRKDDGQLILRDSAMVAPGEESYFADTTRHTTFHANNLWFDLDVLDALLTEREGVLGLPIIVNRKTVDPGDSSSTEVIQVESAMGTAVEVIKGSRALLVPRRRFRPVKTTNELLLVRSDIFELDEDANLVSVIDHAEPFVDLDSSYFKLVCDFDERFPAGVPSMRDATSLRVTGDVHFGADVVCVGDVVVDAPEGRTIPDGTRLTRDA
jgi:UTP--glucose-1-phosphate uridylyltransferase